VGLSTISYSGNTVAQGNVLEIPEHSFQIEFGKLVQYIYLNGLLPALGYGSTAEMFADWIDCHSVGVWLEDQIGYLTVAAYEGYCNAGIALAGDYIDGQMATWIDVTTEFTLQGTADAGTLNERRVVQTLVNGLWQGSWTEGTSSATFDGDFTGERRP
jgi:hypothetical protein